MTAYCYYTVEPPTKWQAGTVGEAHVPFYFDCADCGADEPEIAGVIAPSDLDHAPRFSNVGITGELTPVEMKHYLDELTG